MTSKSLTTKPRAQLFGFSKSSARLRPRMAHELRPNISLWPPEFVRQKKRKNALHPERYYPHARIRVFHHSGPEIPGSAREGKLRGDGRVATDIVTVWDKGITGNSDDFIYELKIDGFRAFAHIENGQCDLVSRNGNTFRNFRDLAQWIVENPQAGSSSLSSVIFAVLGPSEPAWTDSKIPACHDFFIELPQH